MPETVFIDYDVVRAAPRQMNYSGIGDVLCFHTGVLDRRYASERGRCESKWSYDASLAAQSLEKVEAVLRHKEDIRDLTDKGIAVLVDGLKWGTSFHGAGWMPRHIEGIDHFVFYALEQITARKIVVLATGPSKAAAVAAMLGGAAVADCPAAILTEHPSVQLLFDEALWG